jgi:lambda family phage portal protein
MSTLRNSVARREVAKYLNMQKAKTAPIVPESAPVAPPRPVMDQNTGLDLTDLNMLTSAGLVQQAPQSAFFDGNKFFGGFGPTQMYITDYWELRAKSTQLFKENLYARGIIRRYVTNVINTGLSPEAMPEESILGLPEDSLDDWTEDVENRFHIWATRPEVCDFKKSQVFGKIQRTAKREAIVSGDVLVVLRFNSKTQMPAVQLVSGSKVQTSLQDQVAKGHKVRHGVELNADGQQVAYWVRQDSGKFKRLPRVGRRGRRVAFLLYGTDKRMDEVRGEPILSIVLQSLREIDRYRDSAQRKAVINSMLALVVTKKDDKPGTTPLGGGALRKDTADVVQGDGTTKEYNLASQIPGVVLDELQTNEDVKGFGSEGIDVNFPPFEEAIVSAMAWAMETPPEILKLAFSSNYSASQAANNEYKIFLNKERQSMGDEFCSPVYELWMIAEVLRGIIQANGLLEAWRNPQDYETFGAWVASDWSGAIKPATDIVKMAKGMKVNVDENFYSRQRACREVSGEKLSKVIRKNKKANLEIADAARPLLELKQEFASVPNQGGDNAAMSAMLDEKFEEVMDTLVERTIDTLAEDAVVK